MPDKQHICRDAVYFANPVVGILGAIAIERVGRLRMAEIKTLVLSLKLHVKWQLPQEFLLAFVQHGSRVLASGFGHVLVARPTARIYFVADGVIVVAAHRDDALGFHKINDCSRVRSVVD